MTIIKPQEKKCQNNVPVTISPVAEIYRRDSSLILQLQFNQEKNMGFDYYEEYLTSKSDKILLW